MLKRGESEWIEYTSNLNLDNFYHLCPFLEEGMFGKLKKIFTLLNQYYIIIDNIRLLSNNSRQYKINHFLTKNDDVFKFKYAEIIIKSLNYEYHIEFIKSKKGIVSEIVTINNDNIIIKREILDDYRSQLTLLKNKIDKHTITSEDVKNLVIENIKISKEKISDNLEFFVLNYLEKLNFKFYDISINVEYKNCVIIELYMKKKNKILNIYLRFEKRHTEPYCLESYKVKIFNSGYKQYNTLGEAYSKFI